MLASTSLSMTFRAKPMPIVRLPLLAPKDKAKAAAPAYAVMTDVSVADSVTLAALIPEASGADNCASPSRYA